MHVSISPVTRIWNLVREEKADITSVYFYAIFNGLIQLSLPVGIQAIIGFVLAGTLSTSLVILISLIVLGVLLVGLLQVAQMKIIERIQQNIFVRYAYAFADHIPKLDLRKVDSFYLPELVNRFFDTVSLQKSVSKLLLDLPTATIQILFGLILLSRRLSCLVWCWCFCFGSFCISPATKACKAASPKAPTNTPWPAGLKNWHGW